MPSRSTVRSRYSDNDIRNTHMELMKQQIITQKAQEQFFNQQIISQKAHEKCFNGMLDLIKSMSSQLPSNVIKIDMKGNLDNAAQKYFADANIAPSHYSE